MFGKVIDLASPQEKGYQSEISALFGIRRLSGLVLRQRRGYVSLSSNGERCRLDNVPLLDNLVALEDKLFDG